MKKESKPACVCRRRRGQRHQADCPARLVPVRVIHWNWTLIRSMPEAGEGCHWLVWIDGDQLAGKVTRAAKDTSLPGAVEKFLEDERDLTQCHFVYGHCATDARSEYIVSPFAIGEIKTRHIPVSQTH